MGVDGFRVDTVRHIPRISLNLMYNQQFLDNAKAAGKSNFLMFGEICTRFTQIWYRGHAEESTLTILGKSLTASGLTSGAGALLWDINNNMNVTFDHYLEEDDPTDEPTSDNAFLNGIEYHTPDRSISGMEGIDFGCTECLVMQNAYGFAKSNDQYYNDTYNVMYVDSHDYAPEQPQETTRFSGGTDLGRKH